MRFLIICLISFTSVSSCISQSIERHVISPSGAQEEGSNAIVNWTLGELAIETFESGDIILSQGFQQSYQVSLQNIDLDVLVFLEGPYEFGVMNNVLLENEEIPLKHPYNIMPWNYDGDEAVESVPNLVVDWVLVELRDAVSAANALQSTCIGVQAAFLLNDGSVVGTDGSSRLHFSLAVENSLFVIVWHRNHLGILSAIPLIEQDGICSYDFSTSLNQAFGGNVGYKLLSADIYGMVGGDTNGDEIIDVNDISHWNSLSGNPGYLQTDNNLDGQTNNKDKNDLINKNQDKSSQVPE